MFGEEKTGSTLFTKQDLLTYLLCFFLSDHKLFVWIKSFFTLFDMVKENVFELLQDCWTITHKIGVADWLQKWLQWFPSLSCLHPLQNDFVAPLMRRQNLFSYPLNLESPYSLLWVIGYGTHADVPVLFLGLKKPCIHHENQPRAACSRTGNQVEQR